MSIFCSNCSFENSLQAKFCKNCGNQLSLPTKPQYAQNTQANPSFGQPQASQNYQQQVPIQPMGVASLQMYDYPKRRNFVLWFIVSIPLYFFVGSGYIVYIVYIYLNFDDLRKLSYHTHPEYSYREADPALMVLLMIFIPPISLYLKFQKLHEHITLIHPEVPKKPVSGLVYLGYLFGGAIIVFYTFVSAIGVYNVDEAQLMFAFLLGFGYLIGFVVLDYMWQDALNMHINYHGYY